MSVRRAQEEIDSREFAEWVAFYTLEPFGPERLDIAAARIAATVAAGASGKNQRIQDHMPEFGKEQQPQTAKQIWNAVSMFGALLQGKPRNGRNS